MANVKEISVTKLNLANVEKVKFVDPKSMVAKHAVRQLLGQGYDVKILTKDKKIDDKRTEELNKILKRTGFSDILLRNEFAMSYFGRQINTIDVDNGKNI